MKVSLLCGQTHQFKSKKYKFILIGAYFRFLSLTSQNQLQLRYWMTSNRVTLITTGLVYSFVTFGICMVIFNTIFEWNIFPTYPVCLTESVAEQEDNAFALAFFVMPCCLMAYTTPIIDLVTFRLMKFWANHSHQMPKGM